MTTTPSDAAWKKLRDAKLKTRDSLIPAQHRIPDIKAKALASGLNDIDFIATLLTPEERQITGCSATECARWIASGKWTSVRVVSAFIKRASYAHQTNNLLTEICFDQALATAKQLDEYFKLTGGKTVGPLHGVPVSIKDNINVVGLDSSVGFISPPYTHTPAEEDAVLVKAIRRAGGVIFCKTNIPQLMMSGEPINPLWGRSTNPHNRNLITNGSSSGEGGLIAARGSPLGIGTDIGGSIRGPAAYCGIYGLKPSWLRVSGWGSQQMTGGGETIRGVYGPMGSSVADLKTMMRVLIELGQPWKEDPMALNLPWRTVSVPRQLVFGYYTDHGVCESSPPIKRAILMTIEALKKQGHIVIPFTPIKTFELTCIALSTFSSHGYTRLAEHVDRSGDPLEPFTRTQYKMAKATPAEFSARAQEAYKTTGDPMWRDYVKSNAGLISAEELYKMNVTRNGIWKEWLDAWEATKDSPHNPTGRPTDAIIGEVQTLPAIPEWKLLSAPSNMTGTILYNVLDYPGGTIPVTTVDPLIDGPWTGKPRWRGEELTLKVWNDNREAMKGAPCSVQVVGRRREEERLLEVMEEVDRCLKVQKGEKGKL